MYPQCHKLLNYLISCGERGATRWEIQTACNLCNVTGRISDLRRAGHIIANEYDHARGHFVNYYRGTMSDGGITQLTSEKGAAYPIVLGV